MNINDPNLNAEQVVKLHTGTLGAIATELMKRRIIDAVTIGQNGKLIFKFIESEANEATFYATFIDRVILYPENLAKPKAEYLKAQIAANPQTYTLPEIAFLCKILVLPYFTFPITMSFNEWENVARVNPANLPIVFEQLWNNIPSPQTNPETGTGNTGNGTENTNTGTGNTTNGETTQSNGANSFIWSILGGIVVYFITRYFPKKS